MICPQCKNCDSKVIDKRNNNDKNEVRRRRECLKCGERYTTYERIEKTRFLVRKKSGRMEEFDREKLKNSVLKGLKKRDISEDRIERFIDQVEMDLLNKHKSVVQSKEIGKSVLERLKDLDDVAYMLYATVYLDFDSVADISNEILKLQTIN